MEKFKNGGSGLKRLAQEYVDKANYAMSLILAEVVKWSLSSSFEISPDMGFIYNGNTPDYEKLRELQKEFQFAIACGAKFDDLYNEGRYDEIEDMEINGPGFDKDSVPEDIFSTLNYILPTQTIDGKLYTIFSKEWEEAYDASKER